MGHWSLRVGTFGPLFQQFLKCKHSEVILREIDFLLKICWSIACLHPSWKVHTCKTKWRPSAVTCPWNPWTEGKKIRSIEKIFRSAAGKSEHIDRVPYNNLRNREKPFSRHWSFEQQHHSCCFIPFYVRRYFVTALKLAFLSVITGRLCCLVTNQCCHFWSFNVRSVVVKEICEVGCIADNNSKATAVTTHQANQSQ